jgi:CheY-like chemotaxis protein
MKDTRKNVPIRILMADDDQDDREMTMEAFERNYLVNHLAFVQDGEELMEYLTFTGRYSAGSHALPDLILLDLNMPRKDGREALREIKHNEALKHIPVIILSTSGAHEDIIATYKIGSNSFISKPVSFNELVDVTRSIGNYWFEIVKTV